MVIRKVAVRLERIRTVVPNLWAADPVGTEVNSKRATTLFEEPRKFT
jgi:hypothetical protein